MATDYTTNQSQVFARIVLIMEDRINAHADGIKRVQWDTASDGQQASAYMQALVKETQKLHKILRKYMFAGNVRRVFADIYLVFNRKLEHELSHVEVYSSGGKN